MIAGGVAILWRRSAKAGAAATAVIYFVFAVFRFPRFYTAPHFLGVRPSVYIAVLGGVGSQLIVVAAGALVFASMATHNSSRPRMILIARWIFGLCSVDFGLVHLTGVKDNAVYVPRWMPPGGEFWTVATGICFILAGLAILWGMLDVPAARLLALMLFVFSVVTLMPRIFAFPQRHDVWGGNAYNLAAVAELTIDSLPSRLGAG
jgi:uncharacterized membrane protein YphA (DoxX/SURF4 family)